MAPYAAGPPTSTNIPFGPFFLQIDEFQISLFNTHAGRCKTRMKQKRAGLYVRVSTGEQHTEAQERALREYVQRRGWLSQKIYRDKITGATASRPGLDELLNDCRRRSIDVVVVWKFDRFARSPDAQKTRQEA